MFRRDVRQKNQEVRVGAQSSTPAGRGIAILGALLLLAVTSAGAQPVGQELEDAAIRGAVENEFLFDSAVPFHSLDVDVARGIVTISGQVDTLLARRRAVEVASTIKGVRSVVDNVQVEPAPRSDAELRREVEWAMVTDPATESYEVSVAVAHGSVTLEGSVDSWQEKELAARVAEGVKGVKDVRNHLTFQIPAARLDTEVETEIRKRLKWDAWVDDGLITVAVEDGKAILTGTVGSAVERSRAITDAWVPGIQDVDGSGLEVEWWARDEMRRDKYTPKSDAQVAQAVKDAFLYDPRVLSFNPEVSVDNGVVTLSGVVDNLEARRAAGQDARNTVGVALVRNHLRVRPLDDVTDAEITQRVQRALRRDPLVDRLDVGVTTFRGEVSLAGEVDSLIDKVHAETVASGVQGVVDIHNNLWVAERSELASDRVLEEEIKDELFWSPFVDSDNVHVTVDDRVATLTGTVDTWAEYSWAAENAREGGASKVQNQLKVRNEQGAFWMPFSLPF